MLDDYEMDTGRPRPRPVLSLAVATLVAAGIAGATVGGLTWTLDHYAATGSDEPVTFDITSTPSETRPAPTAGPGSGTAGVDGGVDGVGGADGADAADGLAAGEPGPVAGLSAPGEVPVPAESVDPATGAPVHPNAGAAARRPAADGDGGPAPGVAKPATPAAAAPAPAAAPATGAPAAGGVAAGAGGPAVEAPVPDVVVPHVADEPDNDDNDGDDNDGDDADGDDADDADDPGEDRRGAQDEDRAGDRNTGGWGDRPPTRDIRSGGTDPGPGGWWNFGRRWPFTR